MLQILLDLGLTENEINIYLGMLRHPHKTAAEISRLLKLDKSSTYRAVDSLLELGLVFSSPKTRGTTYTANSPEALKRLYDNQKSELETKGKLLDSFIDDLKQQTNTGRNTNITVQYGIEAIRSTMEASLQSKEKFIREMYQRHSIFNDPAHVKWVREHAQRRVDKGIRIQNLELNKHDFLDIIDLHDVMTLQNKYLKEVRVRPPSLNDTNSLRIWDDHVDITSFDDKDNILVITIVDPFVAQLMKNIYDFIWEQSTVFPGED